MDGDVVGRTAAWHIRPPHGLWGLRAEDAKAEHSSKHRRLKDPDTALESIRRSTSDGGRRPYRTGSIGPSDHSELRQSRNFSPPHLGRHSSRRVHY